MPEVIGIIHNSVRISLSKEAMDTKEKLTDVPYKGMVYTSSYSARQHGCSKNVW
jgi:hypothetical protein